ncbi:hypothetical protein ACFLU6_04570 [Acidobacteriota bacterium]
MSSVEKNYKCNFLLILLIFSLAVSALTSGAFAQLSTAQRNLIEQEFEMAKAIAKGQGNVTGRRGLIDTKGKLTVILGLLKESDRQDFKKTSSWINILPSVGINYQSGKVLFGFGYSGDISYPQSTIGWSRQNTANFYTSFPVQKSRWNLNHRISFVNSRTRDYEERYWPDYRINTTSVIGTIPIGSKHGFQLSSSYASYNYSEDTSFLPASNGRTWLTTHSDLYWQVKPSTRFSFVSDYWRNQEHQEAFRNSNRFRGAASIEYRGEHKLLLRGDLGFDIDSFEDKDTVYSNRPDSICAGGALQLLLGEHTYISGDVGYGTRGLDYLLALEFRPNFPTSIKLSAARQTSFSYSSDYSYYIVHGFNIDFARKIGRDYSMNVGVNYSLINYPDEALLAQETTHTLFETNYRTLGANIALDWSFNKHWNVIGSYAMRKRFSSDLYDYFEQTSEFIMSYYVNNYANLGVYYSYWHRNEESSFYNDLREHRAGMIFELTSL